MFVIETEQEKEPSELFTMPFSVVATNLKTSPFQGRGFFFMRKN